MLAICEFLSNLGRSVCKSGSVKGPEYRISVGRCESLGYSGKLSIECPFNLRTACCNLVPTSCPRPGLNKEKRDIWKIMKYLDYWPRKISLLI